MRLEITTPEIVLNIPWTEAITGAAKHQLLHISLVFFEDFRKEGGFSLLQSIYKPFSCLMKSYRILK